MAKKSKKSPVSPIRSEVEKALKRQGYSGYTFAQALKGKVSRTAVYRYLSDGASTSVETIEHMMKLLGLKIVSKSGK